MNSFEIPDGDHEPEWHGMRKGCTCGWEGQHANTASRKRTWRFHWRNHLIASKQFRARLEAKPGFVSVVLPTLVAIVQTKLNTYEYWVHWEPDLVHLSDGLWKIQPAPWKLRESSTNSQGTTKLTELYWEHTQPEAIALGVFMAMKRWSKAKSATLKWGDETFNDSKRAPYGRPVVQAIEELIHKYRGTVKPAAVVKALAEIDAAITQVEVLKEFRAHLLASSHFDFVVDEPSERASTPLRAGEDGPGQPIADE